VANIHILKRAFDQTPGTERQPSEVNVLKPGSEVKFPPFTISIFARTTVGGNGRDRLAESFEGTTVEVAWPRSYGGLAKEKRAPSRSLLTTNSRSDRRQWTFVGIVSGRR